MIVFSFFFEIMSFVDRVVTELVTDPTIANKQQSTPLGSQPFVKISEKKSQTNLSWVSQTINQWKGSCNLASDLMSEQIEEYDEDQEVDNLLNRFVHSKSSTPSDISEDEISEDTQTTDVEDDNDDNDEETVTQKPPANKVALPLSWQGVLNTKTKMEELFGIDNTQPQTLPIIPKNPKTLYAKPTKTSNLGKLGKLGKSLNINRPLKGATTGGTQSHAQRLNQETKICLKEVLHFIKKVNNGNDLLKLFHCVNSQRRKQTRQFQKGDRVCFYYPKLNKHVFGQVEEVLNKRLRIQTDYRVPVRNGQLVGERLVDSAQVRRVVKQKEEDKNEPTIKTNKRLSKEEKDKQATFQTLAKKVQLQKILDTFQINDEVEWTNKSGVLERGKVIKKSERHAIVHVYSQKAEWPILASLLVKSKK